MKSSRRNEPNCCSKVLCCGTSEKFRAVFKQFFVSSFDVSVLLMPFIFKRAGWMVAIGVLILAHCWQIITSITIYDNIRLLLGNYRMRLQGIDMEQLLTHFAMVAADYELNDSIDSTTDERPTKTWFQQICAFSTAVKIFRLMYQLSLVMSSVISLVVAVYIADSFFMFINPTGFIYAVQLIPEAKVITQSAASLTDK